MARCEDYPCCGHPDYDEAGQQLNMKCTCGIMIPLGSRSSLCDECLNDIPDHYYDSPEEDDYEKEETGYDEDSIK